MLEEGGLHLCQPYQRKLKNKVREYYVTKNVMLHIPLEWPLPTINVFKRVNHCIACASRLEASKPCF